MKSFQVHARLLRRNVPREFGVVAETLKVIRNSASRDALKEIRFISSFYQVASLLSWKLSSV